MPRVLEKLPALGGHHALGGEDGAAIEDLSKARRSAYPLATVSASELQDRASSSTEPLGSRSRELWFTGPRTVEVRDVGVPEPGPGELLLRGLASGVSRGTELLLFRGEGPTPFDPSLDAPGAPTYPRRYGYAWVGEVISGHDPRVPRGTRVFALAPHGDHQVAPALSMRLLDPAIPERRAVLAANLETAVNAVWDARLSVGDEVVVVGAGVVGLLITWLAVTAGARVQVVEVAARARQAALQLGAFRAIKPEQDRPGGDADVVFEASGQPAALDRAIAHAGLEADVVVVSFYGQRAHPVDLGSAFHRRRLRLKASQVSAIPPSRARRWSHARRFALVQRLLLEPQLDVLLTDVCPLDRAQAVYEHLDQRPGESLQTVFVYR